MTTPLSLLWIIQLAPMLAFLFIQVLPNLAKKIAPLVGILCSLAAATASLKLISIYSHGQNLVQQFIHPWLKIADGKISPTFITENATLVVGFLIDPLNLLMITLVTTISFFVQLFSYYYMAEDPSRPRYFGFLSFFSFSMTGLVLSNNLLQTFLFWELVGLTSYLLIGFWYEKQSAATAARKAFVLNRLGDLGFYLGVILLFLLFGSLNFVDLKSNELQKAFSPGVLTILGILIFTGVMGKSAQFPFHVWLPDAMEGPTPVSALIHSATMVAAGVFLLSRAFGLFGASEQTLFVILVVGSLTAFVGASMATSQRDIKKIMAYSTVSQLGLMVMAIGSGSPTAGIFHLSTHAYFKALLFLTAGAFIHKFHTNDIWEIGQSGGRKDRLAMSFLGVGLLSLCGMPPFAGFFSKDMILEAIKEKNIFFYGVAVFVSFLTVYYSTRLFLVIFLSKITHAPHAEHADSFALKFCRAVPLMALASISVFVGFLGTSFFHLKILHAEILITTAVLILAGATLGFWRFRNPEEAETTFESDKGPLKILLDRKFFIDDFYAFLTKKVALSLAAILNWFDRAVINGLMVNQTSFSVMRLGRVASLLQNGRLQDYLSLALGVGVVIIFYLINPKGF